MAVKKQVTKNAKEVSKELYLHGLTLQRIAELLNKSVKTIQNYKTKEWDADRAAKYLGQNSADKEYIYSNFVEEMYRAIKDIRESDLKPADKAKAYASIGDSFAKMRRIAIAEDPESYRRSIIKNTVTLIIKALRGNSACVQQIISALEDPEFVKKLEDINV
jgi:hypothetical protein